MKLTKNKTAQCLFIALSLSVSTAAHADFGISVGVTNSNNEYKKSKKKKVELDALLGLQYRGEKFNMDKGVISYDFTDSNKYGLEVIATSRNGGFKAKDSNTFKGMKERDGSLDIGGRAIIDTGFLGSVVIDVTKDFNKSKGFEAGVKLGGISPHAPHWTGERTIKVAPTAGLRFKSKKMVDYYYGVKGSEATSSRKAYKGKSAITPFLGIEAQANMTKHFTLHGGLGVMKQGSAIRNSPLTSDKKYQGVASIGVTYWF